MKRMSFSETIFLFFLALVIFGPKKLPEIARQVGKVLNEFRRASNEFKAQIEQEISHLEVEERRRTVLPPSAQPENTASRSLNSGSESSAGQNSGASSPAEQVSTPAESATNSTTDAEDEPLFAQSPEAAASNSELAHPESSSATPVNSQESHA